MCVGVIVLKITNLRASYLFAQSGLCFWWGWFDYPSVYLLVSNINNTLRMDYNEMLWSDQGWCKEELIELIN